MGAHRRNGANGGEMWTRFIVVITAVLCGAGVGCQALLGPGALTPAEALAQIEPWAAEQVPPNLITLEAGRVLEGAQLTVHPSNGRNTPFERSFNGIMEGRDRARILYMKNPERGNQAPPKLYYDLVAAGVAELVGTLEYASAPGRESVYATYIELGDEAWADVIVGKGSHRELKLCEVRGRPINAEVRPSKTDLADVAVEFELRVDRASWYGKHPGLQEYHCDMDGRTQLRNVQFYRYDDGWRLVSDAMDEF